jgi:hypothetical protein
MKNKLLSILFILMSTFVANAQIEYLNSGSAQSYIQDYGRPSSADFDNASSLDYCVCLENDPTYGGWVGQFDKYFISGGDGATAISFVIRMEEFSDIAIIYERVSNLWVPKASLHGTSDQYYATYNITSGYTDGVLVRIIKNSIDDYSDGWSEWDFHYIRGIWWYSYN